MSIPSVEIRARGGLAVTALLGDGVPKPTGYDGAGWESVQRPKRKPFLDWRNGSLQAMTIALLFDGFQSSRSVQLEVDALEDMASAGDDDTPPPIVTLTGPIPHTDLDWAITDIDWGDIIRSASGLLIRAEFTLTVTEYESADVLVSRAARKKAKGKAKSKKREVWTPPANSPGETLMDIAAREYGDPSRWREIAQLNGIRDPRKVPANMLLRLP